MDVYSTPVSCVICTVRGNKKGGESMPKDYYCNVCKEFPDEIIEHYTCMEETRIWDGVDTYELVDSDFGEVTETTCKKCKSTLEYREEVSKDEMPT
jgi:hypothetical protein